MIAVSKERARLCTPSPQVRKRTLSSAKCEGYLESREPKGKVGRRSVPIYRRQSPVMGDMSQQLQGQIPPAQAWLFTWCLRLRQDRHCAAVRWMALSFPAEAHVDRPTATAATGTAISIARNPVVPPSGITTALARQAAKTLLISQRPKVSLQKKWLCV